MHKYGVGAILCNERGDLIMAISRKGYDLYAMEDIEALVALRGLQMVLHLGILDLILEGGSVLIVEAIHSNQAQFSNYNPLITEIQSLLSCFHSIEIIHVGRQENEAAHILECHTCFVVDTLHWWQQSPYFLSTCLAVDVVNIISV